MEEGESAVKRTRARDAGLAYFGQGGCAGCEGNARPGKAQGRRHSICYTLAAWAGCRRAAAAAAHLQAEAPHAPRLATHHAWAWRSCVSVRAATRCE